MLLLHLNIHLAISGIFINQIQMASLVSYEANRTYPIVNTLAVLLSKQLKSARFFRLNKVNEINIELV